MASRHASTTCPNPMLEVTCAIIEKDGLILATQRGPLMRAPLKWEFPGGKIEPGETAEACLQREIKEELHIVIEVRQALPPVESPEGVRLWPFICSWEEGELFLAEHQDYRWDEGHKLRKLDWIPADAGILEVYLEEIHRFGA